MSVAEVVSGVIGIADAEKWDLGVLGNGWDGEAGDGGEEEEEDEDEDEEERFGCSHDFVVLLKMCWDHRWWEFNWKRRRMVEKYIDLDVECFFGKIKLEVLMRMKIDIDRRSSWTVGV